MRPYPLILVLLALNAACGGGERGAGAITEVTIVPLASTTAGAPREITSKGGQPTRTPAAPPTATATQAVVPPVEEQDVTAATSTPEPSAPLPPTGGRWIDVDVSNYVVRLMEDEGVIREIAPVGVGVAIDTGAYISTQTGLFYIHSKNEALVYDAPFDTYISHWVGFDPDKDNGFHSFLKDAAGNVVDASTGRVSNGCIRTGEPEAVFAYAEIGMPVWVHW
jgi:hypothetical protein